MGQKGSTEQSRIKNILSNHAGLQVPLRFFLQASRLCNQHSIYEKGGKGWRTNVNGPVVFFAGSHLLSKRVLPGTPVYSSPKKTTFHIPSSI